MVKNRQEGEKKNLRQIDRRYLVFYLRVFDGMSSKILGHLVDISEQGVMLISDSPLSANEDYRLRMHLPVPVKETAEILINATSRWCKPDTNPDFYLAGFQLHNLTADNRKIIRSLIGEFGYGETA